MAVFRSSDNTKKKPAVKTGSLSANSCDRVSRTLTPHLSNALNNLNSAFADWDELMRNEEALRANHPDEQRRVRTESLLRDLQNKIDDLS